jgi:plastocyanin
MMKGRRAAPLAGALLAGALVVPAIGAADDGSNTAAQTAPTTAAPAQPDPAPNQSPKAALYAKAPATAGDAVAFEAHASSDPDGKLVRYEWDFDGDGSYESDGKASPTLEHTYSEAGTYEVGLRVTDDDGATAEGSMSLEVLAAEQPAPSGDDDAPKAADEKPSSDSEADSGDDAGGLKAFTDTTHGQSSSSSATEPAASPESADSAAASDSTTTVPVFARRAATARAAATTSVTISDFKYSPATVTVNVGDTVRWTNAGPTGHSATSSSGGFDTGILSKGQGGSATFSKAGSFSYICTPHPFMKGTVVVRASGSSSGSGGSSGSSGSSGSTDASGSGTAAGADAASSGSGLASTGANAVLFAEIGFSLLLAGGLLRLVARPRR